MNYLYQWVHRNYAPRRWMAFAFYSCMRNQCCYVAFPFNLLVALAWWMQDKWAHAANAPSWIEREVNDRFEHYRNSIHPPRPSRDETIAKLIAHGTPLATVADAFQIPRHYVAKLVLLHLP